MIQSGSIGGNETIGINSSAEWREVFSADTEDINPLANWREVFRADWDEAFRPYLADLARCVKAAMRATIWAELATILARDTLQLLSERIEVEIYKKKLQFYTETATGELSDELIELVLRDKQASGRKWEYDRQSS